MHDLKVWPDIVADGAATTTTSGKPNAKQDQMSRLAKVNFNPYNAGIIL